MAKNIFTQSAASVAELSVPPGQEDQQIASLTVNGKCREFIMNGPVKVRQSDRVQVDAAADGTMHVTTCKGSVGMCDIQLLDRPVLCTKSTDFAIKCYTKEMKSLKSRKASVTLYPNGSGSDAVTFSGIIVGSDVVVQYDNQGILQFVTVLHMLGSWED